MSGDVTISSSSLIFPLNMSPVNISLTFNDTHSESFTNVNQIELFNHESISISSSNITLSNGDGFYSSIRFINDIELIFESIPASISMSVSDEPSPISLIGVKSVTINNDGNLISLSVRNPTIRVQGITIFKELYSVGEFFQKTKTAGQDLTVTGISELKILLSDTYTYATSLNASGYFDRVPFLQKYTELSSLPQALFLSIIILPIYTIIFIRLKSLLARNNKLE